MVASPRLAGHHAGHCSPVPGSEHQTLPLAILYGANGSGKSNLVKAIQFAAQLILAGTGPREKIPRQPFLLDRETQAKPSGFEFRILADGRVFSYGFTLTETEIATEWLSVLAGEQEEPLFERQTDPGGTALIEIGAALKNPEAGAEKIIALAEVGVRRNQLFLAGIRESVDAANFGGLIRPAAQWFEQQLVIVFPETRFAGLADLLAKNPAFSEFAGKFLSEASTGVRQLKVETVEAQIDGGAGFPSSLLSNLIERTATGGTVAFQAQGGKEVLLEKGEGSQVRLRTIQAEHATGGGDQIALPFEEESDGTRRLTHLLPALFHLQNQPKVYVIDELDRSLHPLLSKKFLEFFLWSCNRHPSQLILTTHESNLLDLDLLRRDEIWFAEKGAEGSTSLYSLSDFQVRQDLKIQKGYLQGRFGAIPFLGNLEQLFREAGGG